MNSEGQFEAIVCEHHEALYRFAMSLTGAECDARDLTQQTFYTWARKGNQLRDLSKVKSWLFTTLHRSFLAKRRRENRFPHDDIEEAGSELPSIMPTQFDWADSTDALTAMGKVDEVYKGAVALFFLEDYSYREIARILEIPIGTVKSRIARGVTQLRAIFLSGGMNEEIGDNWDLSASLTPEPVSEL
jgi:RNA polymerase sigma factor (sigma-70 family)